MISVTWWVLCNLQIGLKGFWLVEMRRLNPGKMKSLIGKLQGGRFLKICSESRDAGFCPEGSVLCDFGLS
jgi:hypothetical protein